MERVKNIAIIFAGGVGSRMGSEIPKQFLQVPQADPSIGFKQFIFLAKIFEKVVFPVPLGP